MPENEIDKSKLIFAFYSFGMWHIKDALNEISGVYKTARKNEDMFKLIYGMGYELIAISSKKYYFKLTKNAD